jgi:hypothetical protein
MDRTEEQRKKGVEDWIKSRTFWIDIECPPVPTGAEMDPRPEPTATALVDGARRRAGVTTRERAIADLVTAARRRARALEDADAERREMLEPLRVLHGLMSVAELARLIDGAGLSMTRTQLYPYLRLAGVPIGES